MTKAHELYAKADRFAARAAHARSRTERNTYLSLEKSYRTLAAKQARFETAGRQLEDAAPIRMAQG
jgi:hypothetical protein